MPTIRSHFSFKQFEAALQKLAYEIALDAVKTLQHGHVSITISGDRFSYVETNEYLFKFYAKHAFYEKKSDRHGSEWWGFDVEEKLYLTSNHCSKISLWCLQEDREKTEKKVMEFIAKNMTDVSIEPRFKLSQVTK